MEQELFRNRKDVYTEEMKASAQQKSYDAVIRTQQEAEN
jgi:hypothetical protein